MPFYDFGQDLGEKVELNGFVDFGRRTPARSLLCGWGRKHLLKDRFDTKTKSVLRQGPEIWTKMLNFMNSWIKTRYDGGKSILCG